MLRFGAHWKKTSSFVASRGERDSRSVATPSTTRRRGSPGTSAIGILNITTISNRLDNARVLKNRDCKTFNSGL